MVWSIVVSEDFKKQVKKLGIGKRVAKFLRKLSESPNFVDTLRKEPVIFEGMSEGRVFRVRRVRIGKWRLFYVIDDERKLVIFVDIKPRRSAYK